MREVEAKLQRFEDEEVETWKSQIVWLWRGGDGEGEAKERREGRE